MHGTPGLFCVARCPNCEAGWTLPAVSTEDLAGFYPSTYHAYQLPGGFVGRLLGAAQRFRWSRLLRSSPLSALAQRQPADVLDVGCGRGDLGAALIRRGWRVSGIEPSHEACAVACARGVRAIVGTLDSVDVDERTFDAVTMNHSLEHVVDPRADLKCAFSVLRPGGLLLIVVPNFACWQRRRFGSAWFHLDLPRHRTHFSPKALGMALDAAGFEIAALGSSADSGSLPATLQYRLAGRLLLQGGIALWAGFALSATLSPLTWTLDRVLGDQPILWGIARRPAAEKDGGTAERALSAEGG
jgi:SAM-dependent methyltransferase